VTDISTHNVLAFDAGNGHFLGTFASGQDLEVPNSLTLGPDGNLYVANIRTDLYTAVLKFNGPSEPFLKTFVPRTPHPPLAFDSWSPLVPGRNTTRSSAGGNSLFIPLYDGTTGPFLATIQPHPPPAAPPAVTFGPDGNLYVSNSGGGANPP